MFRQVLIGIWRRFRTCPRVWYKFLTFSAGGPQVRDEIKPKDLPASHGGGVRRPLHHDHVDHAELRMRAAPAAAAADGGGRPGDAAEEAGGQVAPLGGRVTSSCQVVNRCCQVWLRPRCWPGMGVASAAASMALPVSAWRNWG